MSLSTKLKKLRKMSADELRCRLHDAVQVRRERREFGRGVSPPMAPPGFPLRSVLSRAAELVPGSTPREMSQLRQEFPDEYQALAARCLPAAERILAGRLRLLSRDVTLPATVDWHADPLTGFAFSRGFYADVPAESLAGRVDVKYVWELNRHQILVTLAHAYLLSGEQRFAQRCQELLVDWISTNPLYAGVNWTSALEAAMRIVSWQWTLAATAHWPGWRDDALGRIAGSLIDHAEYLRHHLSWYSSPYNHLMGEATGLYLVGQWLREAQPAAAWRSEALEVLHRRAAAQFYPDGFTVEQATGYHYYTLGFLLLVWAAAGPNEPRLAEFPSLLRRAVQAGAAFEQPQGRWPAIGDVDSARSVPVQPDDFWDFRGLATLGAQMCGLPRPASSGALAGEETYWLRGCAGVRHARELGAAAPPAVVVLPSAGYALARSTGKTHGDWLCLDAGPIADGLFADDTPSVAHGHLDTLQLLYTAGGRPVLVDGGMPHYYGESSWLEFFRGTGGHNTLAIEGAPVAQAAGRLGWHSVRDRASLDAHLADDAWLLRASLDLSPQAQVERLVLAVPGQGLWVADYVRTDGPRRVTWNWNLARSADHLEVDRDARRARLPYEGGTLDVTASGAYQVRLDLPQDDRPAGWVCPEYGARSAIRRVVCESTVDGEFLMLTTLRQAPCAASMRRGDFGLADPEMPTACDTSATPADASVVWRLHRPGGDVTFAADAKPPGPPWQDAQAPGGWPVWRCQRAPQHAHVTPL